MQWSTTVPTFVEEASRNPLGVVVALAVLVCNLAYLYFGKEHLQKDGRLLGYRFAVLIVVIISASGATLLVTSHPILNNSDPDITSGSSKNMQLSVVASGAPAIVRQTKPGLSTLEFQQQIERARKYSALTDYVRACQLYVTALDSLPIAIADREAVFAEAKECGQGQSHDAVEHLEQIATRLSTGLNK